MNNHKKYLVMINYGVYEGWKIWGESDEWQEATTLYIGAMSCGSGEVIIVEYCPIVIVDGRATLHSA